jgi:DNA-binding GntR family transcriptional regulator
MGDGRDQIDHVYRSVHAAILAHRLVPGTKLPEERLASLLGVSRSFVRQALALLESEGLVEQRPNRGHFVVYPVREDVDDVLDARRILEPELVRILAAHGGEDRMEALRAHVDGEREALGAGRDTEAVRLSGGFHTLLAERAGNAALARTVRQLSALTCLAILVHRAPTATACRPDEHEHLIGLIETGDADAAAAAMRTHLDGIRGVLVFAAPAEGDPLDDVFGARD